MPETIPIGLKRAAIALAEQLDYARAAEQLHLSSAELRKQISALEDLLCLRTVKPRQKKVEPTEDGRFLIRAFREAVEAAPPLTHEQAKMRPAKATSAPRTAPPLAATKREGLCS